MTERDEPDVRVEIDPVTGGIAIKLVHIIVMPREDAIALARMILNKSAIMEDR